MYSAISNWYNMSAGIPTEHGVKDSRFSLSEWLEGLTSILQVYKHGLSNRLLGRKNNRN
jgi:hypothetical protein